VGWRRRGHWHQYRVAGRAVHSDGPFACLAAFEQPAEDPAPLSSSPPDNAGCHTVFHGPALLGGRQRRLTCAANGSAFWLDVEGVGRFAVARDGPDIWQLAGRTPLSPAGVETLLGPCLALSLACSNTWCLHAGAVTDGRRVAALLGESGRGKSTLAAACDSPASATWRRAADDVLAVTLDAARGVALPAYPQLKLDPDHQPGAALPERMPLAAAYVLQERPAGAEPRARTLSPADAVLALVRHTVAALLFDSALLARHLAFCTGLARSVPVLALDVPRDLARLTRVIEVLERDLRDRDG